MSKVTTKELPLAGVVLFEAWHCTGDYDYLVDVTVSVWLRWFPADPGAWTIRVDDSSGSHYIATGIGTRDDLVAKAVELGAEVLP